MKIPWPKAEDPAHLPAPSSDCVSNGAWRGGISGQLQMNPRFSQPPPAYQHPSEVISGLGWMGAKAGRAGRGFGAESRAGLDHRLRKNICPTCSLSRWGDQPGLGRGRGLSWVPPSYWQSWGRSVVSSPFTWCLSPGQWSAEILDGVWMVVCLLHRRE